MTLLFLSLTLLWLPLALLIVARGDVRIFTKR
jgi:hypothetical protein